MSKRILKKLNDTEDEDDEIEETVEEKEDASIIDNDEEEEDEDDDEELYSVDEENDNDNIDCVIEKAIEDNYIDDIDDIDKEIKEEIILGKDRISANRLTKYEMVRILGERIKQLNMGAKPLIKNYESLNYEQIAIEELKLNMIPYKIKRPLPNGKFEIWTLDELSKDHLLLELDD